jgi:predicted dehydrogenase
MKRTMSTIVLLLAGLLGAVAAYAQDAAVVRLITLDPGHFHAGLVQKSMYAGIDPLVHVYAPAGPDVAEHLKRIDAFNQRATQPTAWKEQVYTGPDFFTRMLAEKPGNVVVISGNNQHKADYVLRSVQAGLNVLADKPMAIATADLDKVKAAFAAAESKHVLLYDIMTERFEIASILQRELSQQRALFGELVPGSQSQPSITLSSVHYFSKTVAGKPLLRPEWFFDTRQQGEAIVDVATHLVDLVQWLSFPGQVLNPYDATVLDARRWSTPLDQAQYEKVTAKPSFPAFLADDVQQGKLQVFANGEFTYRLRGVHAKVTATWDFEAPPGSGDTHFAIMRGSKANLVIRQGETQQYKPTLYVERSGGTTDAALAAAVKTAIDSLQVKYSGVAARREGDAWAITVPARYVTDHEAHFAQVTENFLRYLKAGRLPSWEVPGMLTKYATIVQAYQLSRPRSPSTQAAR